MRPKGNGTGLRARTCERREEPRPDVRACVTPTDDETKNGLGVHESRARATANPAASTHNNELNTHDE